MYVASYKALFINTLLFRVQKQASLAPSSTYALQGSIFRP
jgi:hypothetical protein